uniref:Tyrosine specific protein phosphatases domain-containing protein n=2 Tax=Lotharella globosa TaxID=91324 RepID=A0A7S4DWZ7_9EUKA
MAENLYLGRQPATMENIKELKSLGIKAVVSCLEPWEFLVPLEKYRAQGWTCLPINVLDFCAPEDEDIETAVKFIDRHIKEGKVYVHCNAGKGRSAVVVAAYIMTETNSSDIMGIISSMRESRTQVAASITRWPFSDQARALWRYAKNIRVAAEESKLSS